MAREALRLNPDNEDAWLLLAATASPRASLAYLQRLLEINPHNPQAAAAMQWALSRLEPEPPVEATDTKPVRVRRKNGQKHWTVLLLILVCGFGLTCLAALVTQSALRSPAFQAAWIPAARTWFPSTATQELLPANEILSTSVQATAAAQETIGLPFSSITPNSTLIPTVIPTLIPSSLPELFTSPTQAPPTPEATAAVQPPPGAVFWIEVDLSAQRLRAYQGDALINAFIISGGRKPTPTVTGKFRVYVKYRYADMKGRGYYLENVPFVMYFYESYGVHGTYWHNNFGTPMSHGCINLRTEDAAWLYRRVKIGTVIEIHR
ncbi:MAG: hypothetical protein A2Z16_08095 [Chloroflexi bacterium RBG_16_54_18]|nr:MAG: hypothetical protein A2Z16_08095 [Chloroflexi bacterium RBG_16_54_18]